MSRPPQRFHTIPAFVLVLFLLAFGAAGCGDDDSGDEPGASTPAQTTGGNDDGQAKAAVERLYAAIRAGDAEGVCATLTEAGQKQVAGGGLGRKGGGCADAFQQFLDAAERQGGLNLTLKAKVEKVKVDGDEATATVSFGGARTGKIPLVKQGGEWKVDQAGG